MLTILLYTSSHGFGHAVRCASVCRALLAIAPDARVVVRTAAPAWIFPTGIQVEHAVLDAGVVQPSSLEIDARATLERYAAHVEREDALIEAEAARARQLGAAVVVADIPSVAFAIAARAGAPGLGIANFSWDWIYEPFVQEVGGFEWVVERLREQYQQATALLRLPFHDGLSAFPVIEDVPLIARRSESGRRGTRRAFGLPLDAPLVLFSFGGHANAGPDERRLAALPDYAFVATTSAPGSGALAERRGKNLFLLPQLTDGYVDLLAACDVVVTKPGYGIVADLIANRVPALYASRGGFREEPVLVQALEEEARAIPLDRSALDTLELRPALDRLSALDRRWTERPLNGAEAIARRILDAADS